MIIRISAAVALTAASPLGAQTATPAPATVDLSTATPLQGNWTYATITGGSQATFANSAGQQQVTIACTRGSRQVTISRVATGAAPYVLVWTTAITRNLLSSYNPATGQLTATLTAFDPLLDAMAFSRGRVGFSAQSQSTLVVPAWADLARVVEDCRA